MLHAQLCSSYDAACARQQPAETSGRMFHSMALSSRRAVRVQAQSDQHVNLQPAESRRHAIGAISTSIASTVGLAQGLPAWASAVQNGTSVDNAGAEVEQPKKRRLDRTRLVPISSVALARNLRVSQVGDVPRI